MNNNTEIKEESTEKIPRHTLFERFSNGVTHFTSSSSSFILAMSLEVCWLAYGVISHFSEHWLSIIGAVTSAITFLMVFIIQKSQNKESKAIQLKLNELLAASTHASNRLVGIEELAEEELDEMYEHFRTLVEISFKKSKFNVSRSIEHAIEAQESSLAVDNTKKEVDDTKTKETT